MKIRNISFLSAAFFLLTLVMGAGIPTAVAGELVLGKERAAQTALCGKCGDGYCAKQCGETAQSCPKDCGVVESIQLACAKCGDGKCSPSCETPQSCPKDCGVESVSLFAKTSP